MNVPVCLHPLNYSLRTIYIKHDLVKIIIYDDTAEQVLHVIGITPDIDIDITGDIHLSTARLMNLVQALWYAGRLLVNDQSIVQFPCTWNLPEEGHSFGTYFFDRFEQLIMEFKSHYDLLPQEYREMFNDDSVIGANL